MLPIPWKLHPVHPAILSLNVFVFQLSIQTNTVQAFALIGTAIRQGIHVQLSGHQFEAAMKTDPAINLSLGAFSNIVP